MDTLQNMCLDAIATSIDRFSKAYSSAEDINVLRGLELLQRVYSQEFISKVYYRDHLKDEHADLVFNKHLKTLDTQWFSQFSWSTIVETFKRIGPGIDKVLFDATRRNDARWKDVVCHLPNVTVVKYPSDCDDDVLQCIAQSCPRLESLHVWNSPHVSLDGFRYFCERRKGKKRHKEEECHEETWKVPCPLLKEVFIDDSDPKIEQIVKILLRNLPLLEIITYRNLPIALYEMHRNDLGALGKLHRYNLAHLDLIGCNWFSNMSIYDDVLKICITLCPNLKSFACHIFKLEHLNLCQSLPKVEYLTLDIDFRRSGGFDVSDYLKDEGIKLIGLTIHGYSLYMSDLAQYCLRLQKLKLSSVALLHDKCECKEHFFNLTSLNIGHIDFSRRANIKGICCILRTASVLQELKIGNFRYLPAEMEGTLFACCARCPLKEIVFSSCHLDRSALEIILLVSSKLIVLDLSTCRLERKEKVLLQEFAETVRNKPEVRFIL